MANGAAAAAYPERGSSALMSIGEVLSRLRPDFPDITISKLRFLEAEGLVEPYRAPSGYRKYTAEHVEQLRFILAAQRDRYLPLRVIREQLAAASRGERVLGLGSVPVSPAPPAPPGVSSGLSSGLSAGLSSGAAMPPAPPQPSPSREVEPAGPTAEIRRAGRGAWGEQRLTRDQLAERSGLDESGLIDLEHYGVLPAAVNGFYGNEALVVARIAAQLAEYGFEARHLRPYRTMADREVGLLAQLVPTLAHQSGRDGRQAAVETVHELAALCSQLHGALVRNGLRETLGH